MSIPVYVLTGSVVLGCKERVTGSWYVTQALQ